MYEMIEKMLFGYRDALRDRDSIQAKLDILRTEMLPKSPSLSGMPGTSSQEDRMANYMVKVEEQISKLQIAYEKSFREMVRIEALISLVDDAELRQLLTYRYMNGYHWDIIAESMNYSQQRIYQLRIDALRAVASVLDDGK